jgi:UDP-N-acetylglucosamine 1-carboxyvinyltransferase
MIAGCVAQGVSQLQPVEFTVIPDRIEAGTFLVAAAITRSRLTVGPVVAAHMAPLTAALMDTGCTLSLRGDRYCIDATASRGELRCTDVVTQPYPGFPTDMQPQVGQSKRDRGTERG